MAGSRDVGASSQATPVSPAAPASSHPRLCPRDDDVHMCAMCISRLSMQAIPVQVFLHNHACAARGGGQRCGCSGGMFSVLGAGGATWVCGLCRAAVRAASRMHRAEGRRRLGLLDLPSPSPRSLSSHDAVGARREQRIRERTKDAAARASRLGRGAWRSAAVVCARRHLPVVSPPASVDRCTSASHTRVAVENAHVAVDVSLGCVDIYTRQACARCSGDVAPSNARIASVARPTASTAMRPRQTPPPPPPRRRALRQGAADRGKTSSRAPAASRRP